MLSIENKFKIGENVFLLEKKNCPICRGKGAFSHNGYNIICPRCKGQKLGKYTVTKEKHRIDGIRIDIHDEENFSIKYNVGRKKIEEDKIYTTCEEAVVACKLLN